MQNAVSAYELKTVVCPIFTKFNSKDPDTITIAKLFPGLGRGKLNTLANEGVIRRKKTGDGPSDAVLYRVADIVEYLEGDE